MPVAQVQKLFLGEKQSPISPYYEENLKLKSPFSETVGCSMSPNFFTFLSEL